MKKEKILNIIYYIAIVLLCIKFYTVRLSFWTFNDNFIVLIACLFLFVKIIFQRCSMKEYLLGFLGIFAMGALCFITNDNSIFYIAMVLFASKNVNLKKTIQIIFITNVTILISLVCAYFIQMQFTEVPVIFRGDEIRYTFYFNHSNTFAGTVLWTMLAGTYLFYEKLNYKSYIFFFLIILLIYYFTDSRTFFIMSIFALVLLIFFKKTKKDYFFFIASKYLIFLCAIVMLALSLLYTAMPDNVILDTIDNLTSRRIYFASRAIQTYGIQIFPTDIDLTEKFQTETGTYSELHLDSVYSRAFIKEGILFLIFLGFIIMKTSEKVTKKEQIYFIIFAVMALSERYMMYPTVAFVFLFFAKYFFQDKKRLNLFTNVTAPAYHAGPKATRDVIKIMKSHYNVKEITYFTPINKWQKLKERIRKLYLLFYITFLEQNLSVVQYPFLLSRTITKKLGKGNILFIHDLECLRTNTPDETDVVDSYSYIIAHNQYMKNYLIEKGISADKIYLLELFDYVCEEGSVKEHKFHSSKPVVAFAGNLSRKCPFLHQLDEKKMKFIMHLYGAGITKDINKKEIYKGAYPPDVLPNQIDADFGLVWDGDFDERDENITFKNYTRYNNPHKLSCYLAAGIPVIVWEKAAIADFVKKNDLGYLIHSIYDINQLDFQDYEKKKENARKIGKKVRSDYYTTRVIDKILKEIDKENRYERTH